MTRSHWSLGSTVALAALLLGAPPSAAPVAAQVDLRTPGLELTLGGRVQPRFRTSSVAETVDDFSVRRARLELDASLGDFLTARIQGSLVSDGAALKDGWARLALTDEARLTMGQFKRPFSIFELSSSTDLPILERDGRIEGLSVCPGVGGPCTFSRLTEKLAFDDRDIGVMLDGSLGGALGYALAVTNGSGDNVGDDADGKSVTARLEWTAAEGVVISAFGGLHDHRSVDPAASEDTEHAPAGGVDVEVGTWRSGFHLLAAVVAGENWRVAGDSDFAALQALASWYVPLETARWAGVEPVLRVGWASSDGPGAGDEAVEGLLLTPGVMLYVTGKNGIAANLDVYSPEEGDTEWAFGVQAYVYF